MDHDTPEATGAGRLVKTLLPAGVVRAMDSFIEKSGSYRDRNEFLADAIQGHLAELQAGADSVTGGNRTETQVSGRLAFAVVGLGFLTSLPPDVPTVDGRGSAAAEPTWGMHNRDFPTLWAAAHLAVATAEAGHPLSFSGWSKDVIAAAWQLARGLNGSRFDTSGFPSNASKPEASEGRFMRFFVGTEGTGPLFDLGLAGNRDGKVAVTADGVSLLRDLEGFGCDPDQEVKVAWSQPFLMHLARHAPADVRFMHLVLHLILDGNSSRTELVEAARERHPDWSDAVLATNVAGYVARAREWGLMAKKQERGRYVVHEATMDLFDEVLGVSHDKRT